MKNGRVFSVVLVVGVLFCLLLIGCSPSSLQGTYITDDGKQITFNKDGTFDLAFPGTLYQEDEELIYIIDGNNIYVPLFSPFGNFFIFVRKGNTLRVSEPDYNGFLRIGETFKKFNKF